MVQPVNAAFLRVAAGHMATGIHGSPGLIWGRKMALDGLYVWGLGSYQRVSQSWAAIGCAPVPRPTTSWSH